MSTPNDEYFALILSVPRIAAVRPQAATAVLKSLLTNLNKKSKVFDINLDFHRNFKNGAGASTYWSVDEYFYNDNKKLDDNERLIYMSWLINWVEKLKEYKPRYLMISVFTWQCQKFLIDFLPQWKDRANIPVIVGGQGLIREENGSFTTRVDHVAKLKEKGLIAHWVRGEAETTIEHIVNEDFNHRGIDTHELAPWSNVNDHNFMNFDDFEILNYYSGYEKGVLPLESSRGCVRNCEFCDIPTMQGGYRYKTGERMFREVIHYYENYGVEDFFFNDALCNGSLKDFKIFNNLLIDYYKKNNLPDAHLKYSSHYIIRSPEKFNDDDHKIMAWAGGDTMVVGVETGSDRVRAHMKKQFTNQDLDFTMEMFSKYRMSIYLLMIVGFPTETREDFEETIKMLKRYQKYVADGTIIGVNLGTTLTIEEGTPLWDGYGKFNIVGKDGNRPHGPDWICLDNPTLTYKERIQRRIEAQEIAIKLGYTFWKGDDQVRILMDNYKKRLTKLQRVAGGMM